MNSVSIVTTRTKAERRHLRLLRPRARTIDPSKPLESDPDPLGLEPLTSSLKPPLVRPKTRGECSGGERPCPFVGCKYHLYIDVTVHGRIKMNFPDLEPEDLPVSCVLDVADLGGVALETVGEQMNITRERTRQIEVMALEKIDSKSLEEYR